MTVDRATDRLPWSCGAELPSYDLATATPVHQSDVVEVAAALLGVGTPEGSLAYRPGNRFFDLLESDEEFDEITIDISGQTSSLRETLAALDAVQLAIDAAAAAVEYRIQYGDDDDRMPSAAA